MLALISESTMEPVSIDELRLFLRLSTDDVTEDSLLQAIIRAARQQAENYTKRSLVWQTRKVILDAYPGGASTQAIPLPRPPLSTTSTHISISHIQDTTAGTSTTISSTGYVVDYDSEPCRVYPSYGNTWPDNVRAQRGAVTIQYVCSGYATSSTSTPNTPEAIRAWIKLRCAALYEQRNPVSETNLYELGRSFMDALLDPYVVVSESI